MYNTMNPSEQGFLLEELITNSIAKIPGIEKNYRENEIKEYFQDSSLNGVDHWIQNGNIHVLIQDKWKETNTQQEVAQFLQCADRIMSRLGESQEVYLAWACKKEPTVNSMKTLNERNVSVVHCGISIESLAKCVILQICEFLSVDSTLALQAIPPRMKPQQTTGNKNITPPVAQALIEYDETDEGKKDIEETKTLVDKINTSILRKVDYCINIDGIPDTYNLWNGIKPKSTEDWWNGKVSKFDFTSFLKAVKPICWPTQKKKLQSRNLFFYTKLRKISVEFANLANEYESKRKNMLTKKSIWARQLTCLKCNPEAISEAEFKGAIENCDDYWINTWSYGIDRERTRKIPNVGLQNAFYSSQCTVY